MSGIDDQLRKAASKPRVADYATELGKHLDTKPGASELKTFVADAADRFEDLSPVDVREATALTLAARPDARDELLALFAGTLNPAKLDALKTAIGAGIEQLSKMPVVGDAELTRAMQPDGGAAVGDDPGFGSLREHLSDAEVSTLLGEFQAFVAQQLGRTDAEVPESLLKLFVQRVEKALGLKILRAQNLPELLREYGSLLVSMFERPLPVVVVAGNEAHPQEEALFRLTTRAYEELKDAGLANDVAHVGSFNHGGLAGRSFDAALKVKELDRIGLGSRQSIKKPMAASNKLALYGNDLGEEIFLVQEMARRGVVIIAGGDFEACERARQVLAKEPKHVIVLGGFDPGVESLPIPAHAHVFPDAAVKPVETGAAIGELLAELRRQDNAERYADPMLNLAVRMAKGGMVDVLQHIEQNAAAYRIGRILTGVQQRLERTDTPRAEITAAVATLGATLAVGLHGCDNVANNLEWQRRVYETFKNAGPRLAALVDDIKGDVHFASWFGGSERTQEPSYFEKNTSTVPEEIQKFDFDAPNGFMNDLDSYAEKRFDSLTRRAFEDAIERFDAGEKEWQPEIFLGSQEEMDAYYRARGFSVGFRSSDSNGTQYLIAVKGDIRKPIVTTVDCEGRLAQVAALMQKRGVDTSKILVRGSMDRVRAQARQALMQQLVNLDLPIGLAIFNNKNEVRTIVQELCGGVEPKVTSLKAAGFDFDVYEIQPAGGGKPHALVAFKPAYAERTADAMDAVLSLAPVMVSIDGAGGATFKDDTWGTTHRVTSVEYKGELLDLTKAPNVVLMSGEADADTRDVVGVFHQSPPMQSRAYVEGLAQKYPYSVVDQEYGPALATVVKATAPRPADYQPKPGEVIVQQRVHVQSFIHKSDVAGKGYCEIITADAKYPVNVARQVKQAIAQLGVGSFKGASGWIALKDAQPGVLATTSGGVDFSSIKVDDIPVPDHGTVGSANGINDVDQLKGQKRAIVVQTKNATLEDMEKLSEMIRQLDKDRFWLVFDQRDPKQGELVELALQRRFECVVVATRDAVVLNRPTLIMRVDDSAVRQLGAEHAIEDRLRQVSQQGTTLDWFENYALQYRIFAGEFTPGSDTPTTRVQAFTSGEQLKAIRKAEQDATKELVQKHIDAGVAPDDAFDRAQQNWQTKMGQSWYYFGALEAGAPAPIAPETKVYTRYLSSRRQAREQGVRMTAEVNQWVDGLDEALASQFAGRGNPPKHIDIDRVPEHFEGMTPFVLTAASAKSWAYLSAETQAYWVKVIQICANVLDPAKVFYCDGGTAFGLEAHGQEAFGRRGFKSFATLTEDAIADYTQQISKSLTHYCIAALTWAGKSRPLLRKVVERMRGHEVIFGGGEVVAREAALAMSLGVRVHLMTDAKLSDAGKAELEKRKTMEKVVASKFAGDKYKANAFEGISDLLGRLGVSTDGLSPEMLSNDISPEIMKEIDALRANDDVVQQRYSDKATPAAKA